MDKNMVHIDDLVRGRLSGGEEPIGPSSWHTMRELLDNKMPTQRPAGGGGWGRLARYATALALLATFTLGGYQMIQATRAGRSGAQPGDDAGHNAASGRTAATGGADGGNSSVAFAPMTEQGDRNNGLPAGAQGTALTDAASVTGSDRIPASSGRNAYGDLSDNNNNATGSVSLAYDPSAAGNNHRSNGINDIAGIASGNNAALRNNATPRTSAGQNLADASRSRNQHSAVAAPIAASRRSSAPGRTGSNASELQGQTSTVIVRETDQASSVLPAESASLVSGAVASASRIPAGTTRQNAAPSSRGTEGQAASIPAAGLHSNTAGRNNELPHSVSTINGTVRGNEIRNFDTSRFFVRKDTIQTIRVSYRYYMDPNTGTRSFTTDTLSRTKLIVDRLLLKEMVRNVSKADARTAPSRPAAPARQHRGRKEPNATREMMKALPPRASAPDARPGKGKMVKAGAEPSEELVPLSAFKVSSRKNSEPWSPKEGVDNFIRNTKMGLSQMRFYSGILAGLNTSLGNGANLNGFHLGLTGLLTFNEHWSLMAELKYYQRFNGGYTLRDNYQTGVSNSANTPFTPDVTYTSNGTTYNVYNWKRDSMEHYYKFSSLGSLELPIAVRYTSNRLSGFAGVNIVYSLRVNAEEVDYRHTINGRDTVTVAGSPAYVEKMTRIQPATVRFENFDPRLGIGYLLGLAYQITPAVSVDMRMTQTLFDNASSSEGGKKVFNSLYKSPNVQISIGYRFSQQGRR